MKKKKLEGLTEYEKDLAIDPHNLHKEWMAHPILYMKYSLLLIEAKKEKEVAKRALEWQTSSLYLKIKKDPDKYGLAKPTEGAIQSIVNIDKYIISLSEHLSAVEHEVETLHVAVIAFDRHRKKALENLVQLQNSEYFSTPTDPREVEGGKRTRAFLEEAEERERENLLSKHRKGRNVKEKL